MVEAIRDTKGNILTPDEAADGRALYREDGRKVCGARKRTGGRCLSPPGKGRNRCEKHERGAAKFTGPDHPRYKTGRYSQYLPRGLNDDYRDALADEDILNMREQYALLDARLRTVLKRSATGEAGLLWKQLQREWKTFHTAQKAGDIETMYKQIEVIDDVVRRGSADIAAWEEASRIIEQQRKLGESEQKRAVAMQQMVNKNQLHAVMARMADIVNQHTTDPKLKAAIKQEILLTFMAGEPKQIEQMTESEGRYLHD